MKMLSRLNDESFECRCRKKVKCSPGYTHILYLRINGHEHLSVCQVASNSSSDLQPPGEDDLVVVLEFSFVRSDCLYT